MLINLDHEKVFIKEYLIQGLTSMMEKISKYDFIDKAYLDLKKEQIHIDWIDDVDIEGQDILDVFLRGGVVKKIVKKEDEVKESDFIKIEAVGDLW